MRAGESQLSSFELFYDEPARAQVIIATLGIPNSPDLTVSFLKYEPYKSFRG